MAERPCDDDSAGSGPSFTRLQGLSSWRNYRAGLVQRERAGLFLEGGHAPLLGQPLPSLQQHWAHDLGRPERGCLCVAKQPDMGALHTQAVILLLEHGVSPQLPTQPNPCQMHPFSSAADGPHRSMCDAQTCMAARASS